MAEDTKTKKHKEHCSYCGVAQMLPEGFIPKNVETVTVEQFDEESGCFVVVKTIALLACKYCHQDMFSAKRTVRPKKS